MIGFIGKSVILWDFDGVILDSMPVREYGFKKVLEKYPQEQVEELLNYHNKNGGLSRYVKFRYFFEQIRKEELKDGQLKTFTDYYSEIMRERLVSKKNLISESLEFIKRNLEKYNMHIVSGSDREELRFLCNSLGISEYFKTISGSPTPKIELVADLLIKYNYNLKEVCLIGDSKNDFEAARQNKIDFYGYNNTALRGLGTKYIKAFT
ncbi:HAD family hydrolase [Salegentibacter sp. Hel_I_6]|uniref:HAD family hydrolase n=1 Tax=Salegentibacter sp. Hel_I_6 TaxID=1250278 RepID=UPI0005642862|nr:HAD hydrolase-like protein [Salegentibacter sp. Hel_I_6]